MMQIVKQESVPHVRTIEATVKRLAYQNSREQYRLAQM